jgi:hypothetical protein
MHTWIGAWAAALLLAAGQLIAVTGRAVDAVSGRVLPGVRVTLGARTASTDGEGRFRFDVAPGTWTVEVAARGYLPRTLTVEAGPADAAPIEIQLVPREGFEERLDVTAAAPRTEEPAVIPLRPQEVLATAGSLDNPFRTLQTLPGVAGTDEFGSKLSVRGGAPDQNLTLMDGVEIHNPYRLFGLTSAFNPETVGRFELLPGGFGAKYGDRLSSVVIVENRDADASRRVSGTASASITDANIIGEGRLPGPGQGTWLATLRRTYYDLVAERFVDQDLPSFTDAQIKTAWQLPGGRRLSLLGLRSREVTSITPETPTDGRAEISSRNDLITATLTSPLAGASSTSIVAFSRNSDVIDIVGGEDTEAPPGTTRDRFARQLAIDDLSIREALTLPQLGRHQLAIGTEWHRLQTHVAFNSFDDRDPFGLFRGGAVWLGILVPPVVNDSRSTTRGGVWAEDRVKLSQSITLVPGLRWDWSGVNGRASVSPRLSTAVALNPATRLTAAAGLYTQSPGYEKLLQADHFTDLSAAGHQDLRPERASHVLGGVEHDFAHGVLGRVETYYKGFSDLIVGRIETEAERAARVARYAFPPALQSSVPTAAMITSVPVNDSRGKSYGIDLFLSRSAGASRPLSGWISYSLGKTQQEIYDRLVPFSYDRRHSLSVVWNWRINDRWELAGTARAASGFPRTAPVGVRVASRQVGNRLVPQFTSTGVLELEPTPGGVADLNNERMPMFARVDLRVGYRPRGATGRWQLYVEILNVLKHDNPFFVDAEVVNNGSGAPRLEETPTGGFPRLATFGLRFRFP